jgi:hypothetical protein
MYCKKGGSYIFFKLLMHILKNLIGRKITGSGQMEAKLHVALYYQILKIIFYSFKKSIKKNLEVAKMCTTNL